MSKRRSFRSSFGLARDVNGEIISHQRKKVRRTITTDCCFPALHNVFQHRILFGTREIDEFFQGIRGRVFLNRSWNRCVTRFLNGNGTVDSCAVFSSFLNADLCFRATRSPLHCSRRTIDHSFLLISSKMITVLSCAGEDGWREASIGRVKNGREAMSVVKK